MPISAANKRRTSVRGVGEIVPSAIAASTITLSEGEFS
jgi:hypothetical protein